MKPADVCIAIMVAVIWGLAFVASRMALDELPPELMTALRFAIAALPCLFVRKPKVSWSLLIAISLNLFLGQFLAQSIAIAHGVPVGLTSVIVQSQALFTIAFAAVLFGERPTRMQTVGIGVATVGLLMICGTVGYDFSVGAFAVLMISPICFAVGNLLLRPAQARANVRPVRMALPLRGDPAVRADAGNRWAAGDLAGVVADVTDGIACMLFIGGISTCIAYWLWGRLLRDYTAAQVVPFALLVPFVGSAASSVAFGERFGPLRLSGMVIVVCGIAIMLLAKRQTRRNRIHRNTHCPRSPECPMSQPLLIAFVVFAVVMFFTPGPNNIMLLSSGLTYGFRRTVPHIAGITIGFAFMVGAVGLGLGTIFIAYPVLQTILKYAGVAYLVYLAAAIAMAEPVMPDQDARRGPMTFWGAAMFQWINAKGWVMVIGTITAYAAIAAYPWNITIQVVLSLILGALSCTAWALFGSSLRPVLSSRRTVRAFNIVMALLLLASLYPVFMDA